MGVADRLKITQLSDTQVLLRFASEEQADETFHRGKRRFSGNFLKLDRWREQDGCVNTHCTGDTAIVSMVSLLLHLWSMLTFSRRSESSVGFLLVCMTYLEPKLGCGGGSLFL